MNTNRVAIMLLTVLLLAILIMTTADAQDSTTTSTAIGITGAWARPADDVSAAYMRIANEGEQPLRLTGARTEAGMAELHQSVMENDVMRMQHIDGIDIAPGDTAVLEPGGYHIMIMNLRDPLAEGDLVPLTLEFASGDQITINARVSNTPVPQLVQPDELTALMLESAASGRYLGQIVNPPIQAQDFVAPGSDDGLTRLSDTDGLWRVVFFGYMHCPDFCPLTLVDYRETKALLGEAAEDVRFVFVSVDSIRDTPEAMRRYLNNFDPDFIGFSPDDATLSQIQPDYGFYYERRMDAGSLAIYTIDHSTRSYLIDPNGVLRASFAYRTPPRTVADTLLWYIDNG
jgi:protein SCO1/2